jgi:hypothetical protein
LVRKMCATNWFYFFKWIIYQLFAFFHSLIHSFINVYYAYTLCIHNTTFILFFYVCVLEIWFMAILH